MGLSLVVGPAHVGKVALLLERYLDVLERDPWLIVPNRVDVDRVERDLIRRRPALLAGTIGTFDDLFRHVAAAADGALPVATETQRAVAVRRAVASRDLESLRLSAGTAGFPDMLLHAIGELEAGLVDLDALDGELASLVEAYRDELGRLRVRDRDGMRRDAVDRLRGDLAAWDGAPLFAYGFEDLTGAEWALVETLAARTDVTVSIPYEPGRAAFGALARTVEDLAALAGGRIEELPRISSPTSPAALAHLEQDLFADDVTAGPPLDGSIRFLEAAGTRGTVELLASEVAALLRGGTAPDAVAVVCESVDRWRAPLEAAFAHLGIPFGVEHARRLGESALGGALVSILRYEWLGGSRRDLFTFLRSPFSGLERRSVDFVEGRLRGRAVADPARVEEESEKLRGAPVPALVELREIEDPVAGARRLLALMMRNAWGLESPPTSDDARVDARAYRAAERTLGELAALGDVSREDVLAALERTRVAPESPSRGRVAILDHERARTRMFEVVFVLGLEEGAFPRRGRPSPLLSDELRAELGGRLERPDSVARDRYLFYTTCTRATRRLILVREAAGDEGVPREASPFWEDVRSLFEEADVQRATRRRSLSALTWPLESAPSERERLRALVRLASDDEEGADALAAANDWSRRLGRARGAFDRTTALHSSDVIAPFAAKKTFSATELERFADCSSAWLVERVIDPKKIDAEPDPILRGSVLHTTLNRFYASLPRELDSERVTPENLEAAIELVHRCLDAALESGVRLDLTELQEAELRHTLRVDLEGFLRDEAASEVQFVPRRLEVAFGSERAAPELQRGLALGEDLWLSGKIDRIDIDPFSARGIVQDYKSGKGAHSAREIDREFRLQIPLYVLALRDLVGVEPLGGVYRALAGRRLTRGMLRESAREDLPGFAKDDYLDEDAFWSQVESARERAGDNARRIQAGDVRHDPKGDGCPPWCDLPGAAGVTVVESRSGLNDEQLAAVEADGSVFVSAGAGTGKTSVLVERYVRAVCERGIDVESILVITYTRKAAGELRTRIRAALRERGRPDLARQLDGAWISTIHGFCARLLRAHPFAAGLDPRFRELEEAGAAVLRGEAFERALHEFCEDGDPERMRLLATYRADGLRRMLTGVYETLRSAGRDLVLELGARTDTGDAAGTLRREAQALADDVAATPTQRANAAELLHVLGEGSTPERLVDLSAFASKGARAASFEQARKAAERAALEELASHDRVLLQELLERFGEAYAAAKRRESVVDFEDLQLAARDLLRDDEGVREATQLRFRTVMVDEFQDTNRLQCELIDLVGHPDHTEVFTVGDEFQSIYGFRHADLEVFRERREQAPSLLSLTRNYRSRPQVLSAVNHLFGDAFGDDYQALAASAEFSDPVFGHPVELLVTDKSTFAGTDVHWRTGEARQIAARVRELVDSGEAEPGEIVVLFAAGTDAERYEEALRREGLPTYRATGRGYFGQQQVVDLLAYLRLLHNRYDDVALATVLASPFVGISNDALVLTRRNAPRRPLFTALERGLPEHLAESDERLLRAFLQRYERLVRASTRMGLEELCERIVTEHDYDLAVLARWDGARRFANMRKLGRLARDYETVRGTDIEGFVRFVREQDALGAKELEAVAEEEGGGAVRLLTIHAAKGLEFKVVIVADAGRDTGGPRGTDEIVALSDGRFGFRMVHPTRGRREGVFAWDDVKEAASRQEKDERLRLYYVAMTRAIDRLIVSGAIDPGRAADRTTPIGWVLDRLDAHDTIVEAEEAPIELERDEARFVLVVNRFAPAVDEPLTREIAVVDVDELQLALFDELPTGRPRLGIELQPLAEIPVPGTHDVRRLSYSALALFERCSYRYYAERVLGLPPRPRGTTAEGERSGLAATELGDAVHRLLELVPLDDPTPPSRDDVDRAVREWYPDVSDDELGRIAEMVDAFCRSELAGRIAGLRGARPERPFAFEHDGVVIRGRLDVLWRDGSRAVVVDYKSNALEGRAPAEIIEAEYSVQRLVYALVCLRAGADEVEVAYQFLEKPDDVASTTFTVADVRALEAELSEAIARIRAGEFRPTPSEFACSDCPALDLVCAGTRLAVAR